MKGLSEIGIPLAIYQGLLYRISYSLLPFACDGAATTSSAAVTSTHTTTFGYASAACLAVCGGAVSTSTINTCTATSGYDYTACPNATLGRTVPTADREYIQAIANGEYLYVYVYIYIYYISIMLYITSTCRNIYYIDILNITSALAIDPSLTWAGPEPEPCAPPHVRRPRWSWGRAQQRMQVCTQQLANIFSTLICSPHIFIYICIYIYTFTTYIFNMSMQYIYIYIYTYRYNANIHFYSNM